MTIEEIKEWRKSGLGMCSGYLPIIDTLLAEGGEAKRRRRARQVPRQRLYTAVERRQRENNRVRKHNSNTQRLQRVRPAKAN